MPRPLLKTALCEILGIEYPILLAGMGSRGKATPAELVAAISEAGGMGCIGGSGLTPEEIRFAIEDVVSSIIASVVRCLAKAPPEMSQDFLERGMHLVGGGGLLNGLAQRIERETRVPVMMSDMPLEAVVIVSESALRCTPPSDSSAPASEIRAP